MALYLIGTGLSDIKSLSVHAVEILKSCDMVYLESYTSLFGSSIPQIETFLGKKIILADRISVETTTPMLNDAKTKKTALLIIGDVFAATTHVDLYLRALDEKIAVQVVHNASILTAIGITGLELYKFSKTTSMPFPEKNYFPTTAYQVIEENQKRGLHTLVLLDLRPSENRFMTANQAMQILLDIEAKEKKNVVSPSTRAVVCARLGQPDFVVKAGSFSTLLTQDFGKAPHCLIIPGKLHFMEEEMLQHWQH